MLNYFNFKKRKNDYLLTNDFGNYCILSNDEFNELITSKSVTNEKKSAELEAKGFIYNCSKDEFILNFTQNIRNMKQYLLRPTSLHIFVVTTDCNGDCVYCQAKSHHSGCGKYMTEEIAKNAVNIAISSPCQSISFEFQGGEPLMNFDVVKQIVAYARSIEKEKNKNFRFTLTTNGMLVDDDVIEFANKECHNVVLSLDGRKEVHDHLRKTVSGKGSYDIIVPKFQEFVKKRGNKGYYVRGTYTHNNTDFTNDIFHMADLGFTELSMEPVVCSPEDPYALTYDDLPVLFEQYEILAKEMLKREKEGRPLTFYHYMIDLTGGPCIYKRISGCGSGTEYMAVTPWGELYPCHQFVGDPKYSLGNIYEGVTNTAIQDEFKLCNAYARPNCKDCWAKLYCSGGCAANAYHATGSITGIYEYGCELFKKRMECAIMMKVAEAEL